MANAGDFHTTGKRRKTKGGQGTEQSLDVHHPNPGEAAGLHGERLPVSLGSSQEMLTDNTKLLQGGDTVTEARVQSSRPECLLGKRCRLGTFL